MLHRAYALSSTTEACNEECAKLRSIFSRPDYPWSLRDSVISNSAIGKHFHEAHGRRDRLNESHFKILRKCQGKFDCLVFEMLYIKKFKPNLNVQRDSIRAKLFI